MHVLDTSINTSIVNAMGTIKSPQINTSGTNKKFLIRNINATYSLDGINNSKMFKVVYEIHNIYLI